uniref:Putative secreted protein n=1 Tax=Anopheles triannulatus TaxID=58253 RepID=A0A2M4B1T6_9DIPT
MRSSSRLFARSVYQLLSFSAFLRWLSLASCRPSFMRSCQWPEPRSPSRFSRYSSRPLYLLPFQSSSCFFDW